MGNQIPASGEGEFPPVLQSDLKEYVEGINPDLIHKELPYHYSKFLDEFMLCLIDGVENTI